MIDIQLVKESIIKFVQDNGPSLPIHISKHVSLEPLWGSAVLSELTDDKRLLTSHMKVGSSSLFYVDGQEQQLEKFAEKHLTGILKEVYLLLKKEKYLHDEEQQPHIRVALRSLKDFAIPFKFNDKVMWRYAFTPTSEIQQMLEPVQRQQQQQQQMKAEKKQEHQEQQQKSQEQAQESKQQESAESESVEISGIDLIEKIKKYLDKNKIKLIQEIESKKKDFLGVGRVETLLGEIELLIVGKDKKTIMGKDIEKIYKQLVSRKKTGILLITGEIAKKDKELLREYKDVLKIECV